MVEDKLTQYQRIRLEALAQAVVSTGAVAGRSVETDAVVERAKAFEQFIRGDA